MVALQNRKFFLEMLSEDDVKQQLMPSQKPNEEIEELLLSHSALLSHSKKIGIFWIGINVSYWFMYCCRWYVWILYARSLGEHNETIIGACIYIFYFLSAFSFLLWGYIGDKYRFDIFGVILCVLALIGLIFEAIASNFTLLFIGSIIVSVFRGMGPLAMGYLVKFLPHYYAIKYQSFRFALMGTATLLGPLFGGFMTSFFGIKSVYYISAFIAILKLIFMLFFIYGNEKKIHLKQIKMKELYDLLKTNTDYQLQNRENMDDLSCIEYQFPVATDKYILQQKADIHSSLCPTLNASKWFMLINIVIANGCTIGIEGVIGAYFVIFAIDLYNTSVLQATLMISVLAFGFICGSILTPKFIKKYKNKFENNNFNFNFEFAIIIVNSIFQIIFVLLSVYLLNIIGSFWLWVISLISGIELGILNMSQEVILLTIQPKQHAGKIAGAKQFTRNVIKAILSFIVGVLWSIDIYCYLYAQALFYGIAFICVIFMKIASQYNK